MTKTYDGYIFEQRNCEDDSVLCIKNSLGHITPIAETIQKHIELYGNYLSVSYYIADMELSEDKLREQFLKRLFGVGYAVYEIRYSEITGYLYTDENLEIGGHNLLFELSNYNGSYVSLKIKYSRTSERQP